MPKISVVMPLYNVENFLKQSLDSVVNQTFRDIEIICVNDASTDGTLSMLEEYASKDDRIKIITNEINQHCGGARNVGLKYVTGDYFIILDGDDWFELDLLESLYEKITKDQSEIAVCGYYKYNDARKEVVDSIVFSKDIVGNTIVSPESFTDNLFQVFRAVTWNKLIKTSFFMQNGILFDTVICYTDASCIFTLLGLAKKISVVSKPLVYYRCSQKNNLTAYRVQYFKEVVKTVKTLEDNLKQFNIYEKYKNTYNRKLQTLFFGDLYHCSKKRFEEKLSFIKDTLSEESYNVIFDYVCSAKNLNKTHVVNKENHLGYNNIDLVYFVKNGDNNINLLFSLRSVAKFVPRGKIWIVGYKPNWVTNVNYLPVPQTGTKQENQTRNLIELCKCEDISDDFILMNDDFFATKPIQNIEDSIAIRLGTLGEAIEKYSESNEEWHMAFGQINELLESIGVEKPYYNFESHTPIKMNRHKMLDAILIPQVQDFIKSGKVLHRRTLFGNIYKLNYKESKKDVKISRSEDDTLSKIKENYWISVFHHQINNKDFPDLNMWLKRNFSYYLSSKKK